MNATEPQAQRLATGRMVALDSPQRYRIAVQQTTFGWDEQGAPARSTVGLYAPAMFYRGLLAEGAPACASGN